MTEPAPVKNAGVRLEQQAEPNVWPALMVARAGCSAARASAPAAAPAAAVRG